MERSHPKYAIYTLYLYFYIECRDGKYKLHHFYQEIGFVIKHYITIFQRWAGAPLIFVEAGEGALIHLSIEERFKL